MSKFQICYFEGDGYDTVRFESEEELNDFVKKEDIDEDQIVEILEVEIKRVILSKDRSSLYGGI